MQPPPWLDGDVDEPTSAAEPMPAANFGAFVVESYQRSGLYADQPVFGLY